MNVAAGEPTGATGADVAVRRLQTTDLDSADRIMRVAFGTFLGLPDPASFAGDADYVHTRFRSDPSAAFGAELNGEIVASNFATNWGSVGFFGPLTVRVDLWDRGIASRLLVPVLELFDEWGIRHAGLFTWAHSARHIGLYRKFGFHARYLTVVMSKPVRDPARGVDAALYSELGEAQREEAMAACGRLTDAIYEGLDVGTEILATDRHGYGDTILLQDDEGIAGVAVCHCGPGTEAGSGTCFVKFGAVRSGPRAAQLFEGLLDACEEHAAKRGLGRLVAGANMARREAYGAMSARGFRTDIQGVAMQRPDEPGYNRPGVHLIDDWR